MTTEFRCQHCGKLLQVDQAPGEIIPCPQCSNELVVPAAVAGPPVMSSSRPAAPAPAAASPPPPPVADAAAAGDEEELEEESQHGPGVSVAMSAAMPWVISLFFHIGIFLIMALVFMLVLSPESEKDPIVAGENFSENPVSNVNPGQDNPDMKPTQPQPTDQNQWSPTESRVAFDGQSDRPIDVIGIAGGGDAGGAMAAQGLTTGGGAPAGFYGRTTNAHNVVYVIDRSGSMLLWFDLVKREMARSISRLQPVQNFHIIMFSDGAPMELLAHGTRQGRLVPATEEYKLEAGGWLADVMAEGATNAVPALERAFAVLDRADPDKPGKVIFFLTDGSFPDNEAVLQYLEGRNRNRDVHIYTYLYGHQYRAAVDVMQRIANAHGGEYRFVSDGE